MQPKRHAWGASGSQQSGSYGASDMDFFTAITQLVSCMKGKEGEIKRCLRIEWGCLKAGSQTEKERKRTEREQEKQKERTLTVTLTATVTLAGTGAGTEVQVQA